MIPASTIVLQEEQVRAALPLPDVEFPPLTADDVSLIRELAYEACVYPHVPFLRRIQRLHLSRERYVELVSRPEFLTELRRQTFAHLYLPNHFDQKQRELRDAARGRGNTRDQVFGKYLFEGPQAPASTRELEITRTETYRVRAMERIAERFGEYLTGGEE